jgi:hypothetical protein
VQREEAEEGGGESWISVSSSADSGERNRKGRAGTSGDRQNVRGEGAEAERKRRDEILRLIESEMRQRYLEAVLLHAYTQQ